MIARLHNKAASTPRLHLLLLVVIVAAVSTSSAGAQLTALFLPPSCNFQDVSLAPCMAASSSGNISGACCSSLNRALDASHRCVCSLLMSNGAVFASLVTNLLTLPLLLPLPGCFLYAPSLAACQATTLQQQTDAPPAQTATSTVASTAVPARTADPPTPPVTTTMPPPEKKRNAGPGKADAGRSATGNGTSDAAPPAGQSVSRSGACRRRPTNGGQGPAYALTLLTAVAVSWISGISVS